MDLFHRAQEPIERELTWIKPFDNRMEEIVRLQKKSETCPKEMKKVFLSAWGELAATVKLHQRVASQVLKSGLPFKVYYDITLNTDMSSASADFLLIASDMIVVILCKKKEHIEWGRYDTRFAKLPGAVDTLSAEEAACVLADWLTVNRAIAGKDVKYIVPVLIDEEESEMSADRRPVGSSVLYTDIKEAVRIHPDVLGQWLSKNCEVSEVPVFTEAKCGKIIETVDRGLA
ncbi:MAG: hypothetical protein J5379_06895 [Clostridiales bacterium]|nr:hypothetical protein [Clostridiales bacterium]